MAIEVTFNAGEERRYFGECQGCGSKMNWLRSDAEKIVDESGRLPPHSTIECPIMLPDGTVCGTVVYGF